MNNSEQIKSYVSMAFFKSLSGNLTESEFTRLQTMLSGSAEARKHYYDLAYVSSLLESPDGILSLEELVENNHDFWEKLAESEKTAPKVEKTTGPQELIEKVVYPPRTKLRMTKYQKLTLSACAAIILLLIYIGFLPQESYGEDVAAVCSQMNVRWADEKTRFDNGDRLFTNHKPVALDRGIMEIEFDNGVNVVIEGPASFAVERSGIFVKYGRMFSVVPHSGLGFRIETPTAQFVDLGTEFGVQADVNGSAELHVARGKVQLFAGHNGDEITSRLMFEDKAARYDANSNTVEEIAFVDNAFVRSFDKESGFIWRGEKINLIDTLGGGNGIGKEKSAAVVVTDGANITDGGSYYTVSSIASIDGVFLINSPDYPVQITSTGIVFTAATEKLGVVSEYVSTDMKPVLYEAQNHSLNLSQQIFKAGGRDAVYVYSNQGVTFDLQDIRSRIPIGSISEFTSSFGLLDAEGNTAVETASGEKRKVSCLVLVDGNVRFKCDETSCAVGETDIQVEIGSQDRFLTLAIIETDNNAAGSAFFAEPSLVLSGI